MRQALVVLFILLCVADGRASQRLHMRVYPVVSPAPADILIYVGVERSAENRFIRVSAESPTFYRSSIMQLEGELAPRVSVFTYRALPPGTYDVRAELVAANGRTTETERITVSVAGV
jgi:hypothetical protein